MEKKSLNSQSGFSLMEVMIVLVIAAILFTISVAQIGRSGDILKRQNFARQFKISLERSRFDSVKRHASVVADQAKVTIISATSFSVTTDYNQNGRIDDPAETRLIDMALQGNIRIIGNDLVFPITIRFDHRGKITAQNGASPPANINPLFYFCNGNVTMATADASNSSIIYISPTGTIAMMRAGETVPTFDNPTVSVVSSTSWVNPLLSVWSSTSASPTPTSTPTSTVTPTPSPTVNPTPTPTPTPVPTPTPTPTGTPTPTPTVTPTPTPTPAYCTYGQKPSTSGCICLSPMWVRRNGRCQ